MTSNQRICFGTVMATLFFYAGYRLLLSFGGIDSDASYRPSDDILNPLDISKNPYLYKGRSGVLDTQHVEFDQGYAKGVKVPYPGGGLRFEKMIDDDIATYEVLVADYEVSPEGEIAVKLHDSTPPDSSRPWKVFVLGTMDGVNGLGKDIKVSEVEFEGYYDPPTQKSAQRTELQTAPSQPVMTEEPPLVPRTNNNVSNHLTEDHTEPASGKDHAPDASGTQAPAPIERRSP